MIEQFSQISIEAFAGGNILLNLLGRDGFSTSRRKAPARAAVTGLKEKTVHTLLNEIGDPSDTASNDRNPRGKGLSDNQGRTVLPN